MEQKVKICEMMTKSRWSVCFIQNSSQEHFKWMDWHVHTHIVRKPTFWSLFAIYHPEWWIRYVHVKMRHTWMTLWGSWGQSWEIWLALSCCSWEMLRWWVRLSSNWALHTPVPTASI